MKPWLRSLPGVAALPLVVAVAAAFTPGNARAGIFGDMTQMFMSNATAPSTITTKDRMGVFAGSVAMRSPVHAINIVAFDPPRLDAGCGGIDLYGGSFSFINSQELVQVFRQVAANAVGLAFKAAIQAISPQLSELMSQFQTLMQNMNNLAKNSCQLAHLIVDPLGKAIGNAISGDGNVGSTSSGMFTDSMSALNGYLKNANAYLSKQGEVNSKAGNMTAKAVMSSGAASIMGMAGIPNVDGSMDNSGDPNSLNNRVLISVLGYEIGGVPCKNQNRSGQPNTTKSTANANLGTIDCEGPALLTLDDLVKGGGTGSMRPTLPLSLYRCIDPNGSGTPNGGFDPQICTQMKPEDFNYSGIDGWINTMLFGGPDPGLGIDPNSIVGLMTSGTSVKFSPAQLSFLKQAQVPLIPLFARTSNNDFRAAIAQKLGHHISDCVAARMGEALYKGANTVQTGGYTLSAAVKGRIDALRADYLAKQQDCLNDDKVLQLMTTINEGTRVRSANLK
jgi:conjugative transfer pilus assembly protein TraH